jgi:rod shape-determining protein MreC
MQNLLDLLLRYHAFILFVVLQAVGLSLVFSKNPYQRSAFRAASQEAVGTFHQASHSVKSYFYLKKTNDSLATEVAHLIENEGNFFSSSRNRIPRSMGVDLGLDSVSAWQLIPARVISNSVLRRNNYITIDLGKSAGIEENMGIISPKGVIGTIKGVSTHFASAISLLHTDFAVGARIADLGENGILIWDGNSLDHAILTHIPGHVAVAKGQKVEVNAYAFLFPESTPIGEVVDFGLLAGNAFYSIKVKLYQDFRNLDYVYVVRRNMVEEKNALEMEVVD